MVMENKIPKKILFIAISLAMLALVVYAPAIPISTTTLPLSPDADNDKTMEYRGFVNDTFNNVVYSKPGLCDTASPPAGGCTPQSHQVICSHNPDRVWVAGRGTYDSACPTQNIFIKPDCDDSDSAYYPQALPMNRDIKNMKVATTAAFNRDQVNECRITPTGEFNIFDNLQLTLTMDKKYKCFVNEATYLGGFLPGATNKTFTAKAYIVANGREFEIGGLVFTATEDENLNSPSRDNEYTTEIIGSPAIGAPAGFIADKTAQRELLALIDQKVATKLRLKWNHAYKGAQVYEAPIALANGIEDITNLRAEIDPTYARQEYARTGILPTLPINGDEEILVTFTGAGSARCHTIPGLQVETGTDPAPLMAQVAQVRKLTSIEQLEKLELKLRTQQMLSLLEGMKNSDPAQYRRMVEELIREGLIDVSAVSLGPDYSKPVQQDITPIVKEKETTNVPVTTCKRIAGEGGIKVIFIAGKSANMSTTELETLIKEFKTYMEKTSPMSNVKVAGTDPFSYYIDEIIYNDLAENTTTKNGRTYFAGEVYEKIKTQTSCRGQPEKSLYVFFNNRTYWGYAAKSGRIILVNGITGIRQDYINQGISAGALTQSILTQKLMYTLLHESGHAVGALADEYFTDTYYVLSEDIDKQISPNCTYDPVKRYGKYGDGLTWQGCYFKGVFTDVSKNISKPLYRPSDKGLMNVLELEHRKGQSAELVITSTPKYNTFDCAYMAAGFFGGNAENYMEKCLTLDTIKPKLFASSTTAS